MPEGPEVAIVAEVIQEVALNKRILETVIVQNVPGTSHRYDREKPKNWDKITQPFYIKAVRTHGKLISLDIIQDTLATVRDYTLLVTLGMSGDFQQNAISHKHCRYAFKFENGEDLSFIDMRCFGTLRILKPSEAAKAEAKIGWDLLQAPMPDEQWRKLKYKAQIAPLEVGDALLQQKHWSGLGNIYRGESLYRLGINPFIPISMLKEDQWASINTASHQLLQEAYKLKGCSVADFTANGKEGQAQTLLQIYGKDTCPKGHPVQKAPQSERTMWYCPVCQPNV